MDKATKDIPE